MKPADNNEPIYNDSPSTPPTPVEESENSTMSPNTNNSDTRVVDSEVEPSTEAVQSDAPRTEPATATPPPVIKSKKPSRKKWFALGGGILALLILIGGSAAAYFLWYQNPQKALTDAFSSVLQAETAEVDASFDITADGQNAKIDMLVKHGTEANQVDVSYEGSIGMMTAELSGSVIIQNDSDLFVKVNNVKKIINGFSGGAQLPKPISDIVTKIDGNWVYISSDKVEELNQEASEAQKCYKDLRAKLASDDSYKQEAIDAYKDNTFIIVKEKLEAKNGNLGYVIGSDQDKYIAFIDQMEDSKIYKAVVDCAEKAGEGPADDYDMSEDFKKNLDADKDNQDNEEARIEIWVDRWSHDMEKVVFSVKDDEGSGTITANFDLGADVKIEEPAKDVTLDELIKDFENLQQQYMSPQRTSSSVSMQNI